jgi:hypothetical protein
MPGIGIISDDSNFIQPAPFIAAFDETEGEFIVMPVFGSNKSPMGGDVSPSMVLPKRKQSELIADIMGPGAVWFITADPR